MARDLRLIDNELIYHAVSRGSNRGPIAWDHHDYDSLTRELGRAAKRHGWQVFGWCLLPNHYHVLLRTPQGGFSPGFQVINGSHSRWTNRRHGRSDHLFRNRPRTVEIASDAHLVAAILYVARNPVAAGLSLRAGGWAFSSYRATMGQAEAPAWLAVDEVLQLFGSTRQNARSGFAQLVHNEHLPVSDTEEEMPVPS